MMRKGRVVLFFVLLFCLCFLSPKTTLAEKKEDKLQDITVEEFNDFLEHAEEIPTPDSSEYKQGLDDGLNEYQHAGSYIYNISDQTETFVPFYSTRTSAEFLATPSLDPIQAKFYNDIDEEISSFSIVGSDDRVKVTRTTDGQWRNTVRLLIYGSDGKNYLGSGFMIGPNSVATSGHCVYNTNDNQWIK